MLLYRQHFFFKVIHQFLQTPDQGVIHLPPDQEQIHQHLAQERIHINLKQEQIHTRLDQDLTLIHRHDRILIQLQGLAEVQVHQVEVEEDKVKLLKETIFKNELITK